MKKRRELQSHILIHTLALAATLQEKIVEMRTTCKINAPPKMQHFMNVCTVQCVQNSFIFSYSHVWFFFFLALSTNINQVIYDSYRIWGVKQRIIYVCTLHTSIEPSVSQLGNVSMHFLCFRSFSAWKQWNRDITNLCVSCANSKNNKKSSQRWKNWKKIT